MADSIISRRTFLKGALAACALVPIGGALAACSSGDGPSDEGADSAGQDDPRADREAFDSEAPAAASGSILVAYYSAQGHTERVAQALADELGADLFAVVPVEPYTDDDLDWSDEQSRVSVEHEDPGSRHVELEEITPDGWDGYDTVLVGYPIWWGDAAWPIDDFISGNDFSGKTVIPFCTSLSSSIGDSGRLLAEMADAGDWREGRRFGSNADAEDVSEWVASLSL